MKKLWKLLEYLTNNEEKSRHEEIFDAIFLIVNTLALIIGAILLFHYHEIQWLPFLTIEFCWAFDNLRNNRMD